MAIGPNGEVRPSDPIAQAVLIGKIATRQVEDPTVHTGKSAAGRRGAKVRAERLNGEQRKAVAKAAAKARWEQPVA